MKAGRDSLLKVEFLHMKVFMVANRGYSDYQSWWNFATNIYSDPPLGGFVAQKMSSKVGTRISPSTRICRQIQSLRTVRSRMVFMELVGGHFRDLSKDSESPSPAAQLRGQCIR